MKTAVSLSDELFRSADAAAEALGLSRSQLYARAISEFLQRQGADPVTAALDALADELGEADTANAGRVLIDSGAWQW